MKKLLFLLLGLSLFLAVTPAQAATLKSGDTVTIDSPVQDDLAVDATTITINKTVMGEAVLVGSTINVNQTLSRSLIATGGTINVNAGSSYDTVVLGNSVVLKGHFAHDVYVFGSKVTLDPSTVIDGTLTGAVNSITLAGNIHGDVNLYAQTVTTSAVIGGDLSGTITSLEFTGGSVAGNVHFESSLDAINVQKVKIGGSVTRTAPTFSWGDWVAVLLSTILFVIFVILINPREVLKLQHVLQTGNGLNFLIGLATLIGLPILGFLFLATGLGWLVALLIFAVYTVLLCACFAYTMIVVGSFIARWLKLSTKSQIPAAILAGALGVIAFMVVELVPYIGSLVSGVVGIITFLILLGGLIRATLTENYH